MAEISKIFQNSRYANEFVNVKDFGAVGDGVADDWQAFSDAISAADVTTKVVIVPDGAYVIDTDNGSLDVPMGVSVVGESGIQINLPSVLKQGPTLYIKGTANSPFTVNRGCVFRRLNFFWPDQAIDTFTPTAYPHCFTHGSSGMSKAEFHDLLFINCDKFLKTGDNSTSVPGGGLFMRNVKGMFFREFVRQENSQAISHIDSCASSALFAPGSTTNSQNFASQNLDLFILNGFNDGLKVSGFSAFRANRLIFAIDDTSSGNKFINFAKFTDCMLDGIRQGFASDTFNGPLSLQFDHSYFRLDDINDSTSAPTGFDFTFSSGSTATDKTVQFNNCRFRASMGEVINVGAGTNGLDRLILSDSSFLDWGTGSSAPANVAAINLNRSAVKASIDNCHMKIQPGIGSSTARGIDAESFDTLSIEQSNAENCDRGFAINNGNNLVFNGNSSVNSGTVGAVVLGTVTNVVWTNNDLDIHPTATYPTRPSFLANSSNGQTAGAGINTIQFNVESFDRGGDYDNTTYTFTAPIAGSYHIESCITHDSSATAGDVFALRINSSNRVLPRSYYVPAATRNSVDVSGTIDMDVGDTVLIDIQRISGTGSLTLNTSSSTNWFSARLIE